MLIHKSLLRLLCSPLHKMSEFIVETDKHETSLCKRNDKLEAKKNLQEKLEKQATMICTKRKDVAELKDLISKQKYTRKDKQALLEKKKRVAKELCDAEESS